MAHIIIMTYIKKTKSWPIKLLGLANNLLPTQGHNVIMVELSNELLQKGMLQSKT